ncbi:MAG: IS701 family transposase [Acidobacteria bacterium]|nr:IS701 family transposase [Acidobacteriota bacterium]
MLRRLMRWLTPFKACFGHRAQTMSLGHYVSGLLSDSPRKSMQAMLARVTDPPSYQTLQHFITHAPWSAARMWQILRARLPERRGILLLDDTGFAKKGDHSVGVARQYSGTLGKIGNCQVAVTAALWTGQRAWLVGAAPYLPEAWATDPARRQSAHLPAVVRFRKKWELALQLLRQVRASGVTITAVLSDSGYGDATTLRTALHRLKLPYGLGVSSTLTVFRGTPQLQPPRAVRGPRQRWPRAALGDTAAPLTVQALAASLPAVITSDAGDFLSNATAVTTRQLVTASINPNNGSVAAFALTSLDAVSTCAYVSASKRVPIPAGTTTWR